MDARIPINYRSAVAVRTIVEHGIAPGLSWQVVRFGRHSVLDAEGSKRAEAQLRALLATSVGWPRSAREGVGGSPANALLSHLLLIELRAALAQYAYMDCRDVSASDEADALARSAPSDLGALLLCARSADGKSGWLQTGDLALRFALRELATLRFTSWEPARGPGGYDLTAESRRGHTIESKGMDGTPSPLFVADTCQVSLPFAHAAKTSLDLVRAARGLASALDVAFEYKEFSDV